MIEILIGVGVSLMIQIIGFMAVAKYLVNKLATKDQVKLMIEQAKGELKDNIHQIDTRLHILEAPHGCDNYAPKKTG